MMKGGVKITSRMLSELCKEQKRTNLGATDICNGLNNRYPDLTVNIIGRWTRKTHSGNWKPCACKPAHYNAVMKYLARQPDAFYLEKEKRRTKLIQEMKRTNLKAFAIRTGLGNRYPELTWQIINKWLFKRPHNGAWAITACNRTYYKAVMQYLARQPDAFHLDANRRSKLIQEIRRTNLKASAIRAGLGNRYPELTRGMIEQWFQRVPAKTQATSICNPKHYNTVIAYLAQQPDAFYLDDENRRQKLIAEMKRTHKGVRAVRKGMGKQYPDLTEGLINSWVSRNPVTGEWMILTCNSDYYNAVIAYLSQQPDAFYLDAKNRRSKLMEEMKRTRKGASAIRKGLGKQHPNLKYRAIQNWVTKRPDAAWHSIVCKPEHYLAVMAYLTQQPDSIQKITGI